MANLMDLIAKKVGNTKVKYSAQGVAKNFESFSGEDSSTNLKGFRPGKDPKTLLANLKKQKETVKIDDCCGGDCGCGNAQCGCGNAECGCDVSNIEIDESQIKETFSKEEKLEKKVKISKVKTEKIAKNPLEKKVSPTKKTNVKPKQ